MGTGPHRRVCVFIHTMVAFESRKGIRHGRRERLVLDVLKPHQPNALVFSQNLAATGAGYRVQLTVSEVDEHTETLRIVIAGDALDSTRSSRQSSGWAVRCTASTKWRCTVGMTPADRT